MRRSQYVRKLRVTIKQPATSSDKILLLNENNKMTKQNNLQYVRKKQC